MSKKKNGFVRILWGAFLEEDEDALKYIEEVYGIKQDAENNMLNRRVKIEEDIEKSLQSKFPIPSVIYVYGKNNYNKLVGMGQECVLVHDEPYKYHPIKGVYKHKIDAQKYITEDYEEYVFIDFDCKLKAKLPIDFWKTLGKKEILQASLHQYATPRMSHRKVGGRRSTLYANKLTPTGAFVYMRGDYVANRLCELNETVSPNKWSCEPAMGILTDEICGGWKGIEKYWELFEPDFYIAKKSPYRWDTEKYKYKKDNVCFEIKVEEK